MKNITTDELAKILWEFNNLHQKVETADVVICLGSHDTRVAERGAELYLNGFAPLIVMSGGAGRLTPDEWNKSESEVFADVAIKMGVPKEKILLEDKSTNTAQNVEFSLKLLKDKKIDFKKVILVHKPYMERRAMLTWKLKSKIPAIVTSPQLSFDKFMIDSPVSKEENIAIVVGDIQRIRLYSEKGFIYPDVVPDNVWEAYEELVNRGFASQLVKS